MKHSLIPQIFLETCHVEIYTLHTKACHHSNIGSDAISRRPFVDNAHIVPLQIATAPISFRRLVKTTLGKGLVCISYLCCPHCRPSLLHQFFPENLSRNRDKPLDLSWCIPIFLRTHWQKQFELNTSWRTTGKEVVDIQTLLTQWRSKMLIARITAPATTSASPVGRAVAAYLRDAHDIPWPFVTNRFQPLVERAVSKQKNTMIGINMNLSRSSNKTCHVLFALTIKPTCDSTVTKSFRSETVSGYDCAKKRMFSAKLAIPHIISFQRSVAPPTFHSPLQHCGKRTNPCLTPQIMGKLRLDRHLPRASPDWPSCSLDSIHIMWWKHALHSKE